METFVLGGVEYTEKILNLLDDQDLRDVLSAARDELFDVETFLDIDDLRDPMKTKKRRSFKRRLEAFIDEIEVRLVSGDKFRETAKLLLTDDLYDEIERASKE